MKPEDNNEGLCPKCLSDNIDYKAMIPEDYIILLPKECLDCKEHSIETYQLKYLRTDKK